MPAVSSRPRADRRTNTPTRAATLAPTDPHLTALLLLLRGPSGTDEDGSVADRFAELNAIARAMLSSRPLTSAFAEISDRPSVADLVVKRHATPAELKVLNEEDTASSGTVYGCISDATLVGACVMYRLLRGKE